MNNFTGDTDRYFEYLKRLRSQLPPKEYPFRLTKEALKASTHLYPDSPGYRHYSGVAEQFIPNGVGRFGFRTVESEQVYRDYIEIAASLRGNGTTISEDDGIITLATDPPEEQPNGVVIRQIDQKFGFQNPFVLINVSEKWRPRTGSLLDICRQSAGADYFFHLTPENIPTVVRRQYLQQVAAATGAQLQRRNNEAVFDWLARRFVYGFGADITEKLLFEVKEIAVSQRNLSADVDPGIVIKIVPVNGSRLQKVFKTLGAQRSPLRHPDNGFLTVSARAKLPKEMGEAVSSLLEYVPVERTFARRAVQSIVQTGQGQLYASLTLSDSATPQFDVVLPFLDFDVSDKSIADEIGGKVNTYGVAESSWEATALDQTLRGRYALAMRDGMLKSTFQLSDQPVQQSEVDIDSESTAYSADTIFVAKIQLKSLELEEQTHPLASLLVTFEKMYETHASQRLKTPFDPLSRFQRGGNGRFVPVFGELSPEDSYTAEVKVRVVGDTLVIEADCSSDLVCMAHARSVLTNRTIRGPNPFN